MKFSVIVPVYKVEEYLPICVESILQQVDADFEVILVDDGSPDNCGAICDHYAQKDNRVKVIHKENGGLSDARNFGIDASIGDYLLFVDSDDFWSCPNVLSTVENAIKNTNATIVQYGRQNYLNVEDRYVPVSARNLSQYNNRDPQLVLRELVESGEMTISACSIAVSAAFLKKNNVYFTKGIKTEDLEWAIRLYIHEPVWAFCDEHFYIYRRQREGSITGTIDYKHLCDYCWIIESKIDLLEKEAKSGRDELLAYMMYHVLICCALCYRCKLTGKQRAEVLKRMRQICKGRMNRFVLGKKVQMGSVCYKFLGFHFMAWVVGLYLNHRGR